MQTREIKKRIKSVTNTKQIMKAMELVSVIKMQKAIDNNEAMLLHNALVQHIESILKIEPLLKKIADELYVKPEIDDFPSVEQLSIFYSVMLLNHPDATNQGEDRNKINMMMCTLIKNCMSEANQPVQNIANQIIQLKINDCRFPAPIGDQTFIEPRRYFQMLKTYWNLCRTALINRTEHVAFLNPYPIAGLFINIQARLRICFDGFSMSEVVDKESNFIIISDLIDALMQWDQDEFDIGGEDICQRIQNVDLWLERTQLSIGTKIYEVTQEESTFIDFATAKISEYDAIIKSTWNKKLAEVDAMAKRANSADSHKQVVQKPAPEPSPETATTEEGRFVIERKEVGDEVHWFVNGEDKGRFYSRTETHSSKIIEILFDQIGYGWVRHKTFMGACAWKEDEYFPASGDPGRMQRQLTNIRKFLGVNVEFRRKKGVRFAENVVKSK